MWNNIGQIGIRKINELNNQWKQMQLGENLCSVFNAISVLKIAELSQGKTANRKSLLKK